MFSGKTEELIRRLRRLNLQGKRWKSLNLHLIKDILRPELFHHDDKSIISTPVDNASAILLLAGDVDVVGIDEAQFFDE